MDQPPLPILTPIDTSEAGAERSVSHTLYMMRACVEMGAVLNRVTEAMLTPERADHKASEALARSLLAEASTELLDEASKLGDKLMRRGIAASRHGASVADPTPYMDIVWSYVLGAVSYVVDGQGPAFTMMRADTEEGRALKEQLEGYSNEAITAAQVCRAMAQVYSYANMVCMWASVSPSILFDAQVTAAVQDL